ncbi:hypothetical protein Acr_20g0008420 [Actinidia rufa]|uniref:Uncharacterized protein n=1 Tax=Actinidia rufa TaxID=165716 RepID=A0A7J0GE08_9ERIC|nr:hypothetical protein Acr_20g0008420 [Actinidia rufa]
MSFNTNLGGEESEQSLPSWISDHLGAKSYIDETNQSTSSPPIPTNSSKMDTSSLNKESNVMSQAELDNLGTTCLYSLSPLPDSGWYYFKARPEKNLLRGSPSNVKGWKTRFFFRLGGRVGVSPGHDCQREFSTRKSCNKLPTLSEVNAKRMEAVFEKIEPGGYFEVSKVLSSRTFKRHFAVGCSALSTSGEDNTTSGDEGEFGTGEDSVEYLGVIRRAMSARGKAVAEKAKKATVAKHPTKGVVIREKRTREGDLVIEIGEEDSLKGKETVLPPPPKRFKSNRGAINARVCAAEAGTSSPAGDKESESMSDASVTRRLLTGVIPASDKKEVDQLSENDLVAKSFHALGQAKTRLAELNEEISRPGTEVDDLKATVAELTSKLAKAKELAIEDFKASEEFKAAVTDSAATYFGDGFEFCKRQLLHQFPNLGADVANMAMDPSFAEEEEATKEGGDHV